nr:exopolyphosphatase [uncultured Desulfobacter sp.]
MTKYAAIDIGSNAVRLLLAMVSEEEFGLRVKKISWIRMPIRLGEDAFLQRTISDERACKLTKTMDGFAKLIHAYQPVAFKACATSAMRTARNGRQVCRRIREQTGIDIEIINGRQEARYLFQNRHKIMTSSEKAALFVDVGGGSTEITLFCDGRVQASRSFNLGTIRLLNNRERQQDWDLMKSWLKATTRGHKTVEAIGSGGNINKLFKLAKGRPGTWVTRKKIKKIRDELTDYGVEERMRRFNLKPDRADVIIPGARIYIKAMAWGRCKKVHVPMQGLADGIIRVLHDQMMQAQSMETQVHAPAIEPLQDEAVAITTMG